MIITIFGRIGDSWHIPPSFFAVALQKGREDRNADKRVNIADDRSTSGKNLSGGVLAWLSVCSEVQTCIWPS